MLDTTLISKASEFDSLPLGLIEEATKFSKDVVLREGSQAKRTMLLLTGVWPTNGLEKPYVLLPWSPLHATVREAGAVNLPQTATQWVLDKVASTVLLLDSVSWELYKQKYPPACLQYLLKGDYIWLSTYFSRFLLFCRVLP